MEDNYDQCWKKYLNLGSFSLISVSKSDLNVECAPDWGKTGIPCKYGRQLEPTVSDSFSEFLQDFILLNSELFKSYLDVKTVFFPPQNSGVKYQVEYLTK